MQYGKDDDVKKYSLYLTEKAVKIEQKETVKDLGIIMSNDCTFTQHVQRIINKTKDLSSWILRTFQSREKNVMLTLWKSLVLPHFDYCSQLWSPCKTGLIQSLEMVQKSFIRKIKGTSGLNYWEQLKELNLYSLERRRERYRIIYVWCIIENLTTNFSHLENGEEIGGIQTYEHVRHGRKCVTRLIVRSPYQSVICGSMTVQGPILFNCLPKHIRNLTGCSKDLFKSKLDNLLQTIPDEPQIPNYVAMKRADTNSIINMISIGLNELNG